jgi:hypothetical protein
MEKEIRGILESYARKSPNTVEEDNAYTKEATKALTALFKAKMLFMVGEDYPIVKSLIDERKIWMKGYNQRGAELREKVEGV